MVKDKRKDKRIMIQGLARSKLTQQPISNNGTRNACWYKLMHIELSANAQILYHCSTSLRVTLFYIKPKGTEVRLTKS
jgi:hypothetical protein